LLSSLGAEVIVECADSLRPLIEAMTGVGRVIAPGSALPALDFHVPLLSLAGLFATTTESIPADIPYLAAPRGYLDKWRRIAADWPQGRKIGIAWRGSPEHVRDAIRSPGLAPFMALQAPGVTLVSLQKEHSADELAGVAGAATILDPTDDIADFADTAALMGMLDAVVSCDSAPLHLAGALGVPAFAVLPHVAEWRWGQGDTTPWYPGMTLVRQPSPGDWGGVFAKVKERL
jgi:hypothetical protein